MEEGRQDGTLSDQQENIQSEVFHCREIKLQTLSSGKRLTSGSIKSLIYKGWPHTSQMQFFKLNNKFKPEEDTQGQNTGPKLRVPEVNLPLTCRDILDCNSVWPTMVDIMLSD